MTDTFIPRAENWRRWARGRYGVRELQAESMERLYRSLNWGDVASVPGSVPGLPAAVDVIDAQAVEAAWRSMLEPYKAALRGAWIHGEHPRKTCRRAAVHWTEYDALVSGSMAMLRLMCANRSG